MIKIYIILVLLIILFRLLKRNIENFVESNFSLCNKNDCECLKMNRAQDGSCVLYNIQIKPLIPDYKNKKHYKPLVVRNNKYPLKKKRFTLIFVGNKIKNTKKVVDNSPYLIRHLLSKKEEEIYSLDERTSYFLDIFLNAIDIFDMLGDKNKPFIKYLILDKDKHGYEKQVMKTYKIEPKKEPTIYLHNQKLDKLYEFTYDIDDRKNRCLLLQKLIIFVAQEDCGLISYLNHLHDPFLGIKFKHNSKNNTWEPSKKGITIAPRGTELCKLINYNDLPKDFKCK